MERPDLSNPFYRDGDGRFLKNMFIKDLEEYIDYLIEIINKFKDERTTSIT